MSGAILRCYLANPQKKTTAEFMKATSTIHITLDAGHACYFKQFGARRIVE